MSIQPSWLPWILRHIDGYPSVTMGPMMIMLRHRLGPLVGVSPAAIAGMCGVVTMYGAVALMSLRRARGRVPPWLAAVGIAVNVGVLLVVGGALFGGGLTRVGRWGLAYVFVNTAVVTYALIASARTYFVGDGGRVD